VCDANQEDRYDRLKFAEVGKAKVPTLTLAVPKDELIRALQGLSKIKTRKRGAAIPVWIRFNGELGQLTISEARGQATAIISAKGDWPPTGATIDLIMLRNAARFLAGTSVELTIAEDAILLPTDRGHVALKLLPFGPESKRAK